MEKKIVVKNTCIMIYGYEKCEDLSLEYSLSGYNIRDGYYPFGYYYDEENKILYIPRGLDIKSLENKFKCKAIIDRNYYKYDKIDDVLIKYQPRDEVQRQSLAFLTGQYPYVKNKTQSQLGLYLNTGKGKTYASITSIAILGVKSIIITYAIGWLHQWKKCFLDYTNMKDDEVYIINGSSSIHRLLKYGSSKYKTFLISHATIKSFGDTYGWDKLSQFIESLRVGIAVFDEAHLNFTNMMQFSFNTNIWKTFYVTATPARSDHSENLVYANAFRNVPGIELFDDEEDPHTEYIALKFHSNPELQDYKKFRGRGFGFDRNNYINYLTRNPNYYKMLRIIVDISCKLKGKSLYYIGTNEAIMDTKRWIEKYCPWLIGNIGVYTSIVPKEQKVKQLDKKIILSTTKSAGAATDIKGLELTVVLNEPFKSPVIARQTLGRTRDADTRYIELVDCAVNQVMKFHRSKQNIFAKYATNMKEIDMCKENIVNARLEKIKERIQRESNALIFMDYDEYNMVEDDME